MRAGAVHHGRLPTLGARDHSWRDQGVVGATFVALRMRSSTFGNGHRVLLPGTPVQRASSLLTASRARGSRLMPAPLMSGSVCSFLLHCPTTHSSQNSPCLITSASGPPTQGEGMRCSTKSHQLPPQLSSAALPVDSQGAENRQPWVVGRSRTCTCLHVEVGTTLRAQSFADLAAQWARRQGQDDLLLDQR